MLRPFFGFGPFADLIVVLDAQTRFLLDCQVVVALRMVRLAGGGAPAVTESMRMVSEKVATFAGAQMAAAAVLSSQGWPGAAAAAEMRYRSAVSSNRRRLTRTPR
jgi:hypothetical protein